MSVFLFNYQRIMVAIKTTMSSEWNKSDRYVIRIVAWNTSLLSSFIFEKIDKIISIFYSVSGIVFTLLIFIFGKDSILWFSSNNLHIIMSIQYWTEDLCEDWVISQVTALRPKRQFRHSIIRSFINNTICILIVCFACLSIRLHRITNTPKTSFSINRKASARKTALIEDIAKLHAIFPHKACDVCIFYYYVINFWKRDYR